MAVLAQDQQNDQFSNDKQPDQNAGMNPGPSGPSGPSTGNAQGNQQGNQSSSSQNSQAGTSSGRFTNITNYLKANQNYNQQGGGLAGQIQSNLSNQGQQIQGNIGQAQNQFNQGANQSASTFNNQDLAKQAFSDPTKFAQDENNLNAFAKMRNAQYTGPTSLNQTDTGQNLQNQIQQYQTTTGQVGSESGRFNLLKQMFANPTYSAGQQTLDNLLLQGNQGQLNNLQQTRGLANQLGQQQATAESQAQTQAQSLQDLAKNVSSNIKNTLGNEQQGTGMIGGLIGGLNQQVQNLQNQRTQNYSNLQNAIQGNTLNDEQLASLGLSKGSHLYGTNLNDYLGEDLSKANLQNVASNQDYAKYQALSKLAGIDPLSLNTTNQSQAGTFNTDVNNLFNTNRFNQALASAKAQYAPQEAKDQELINESQRAVTGIQSQLPQLQAAFNDPAKLYATYGTFDPMQALRNIAGQTGAESLVTYGQKAQGSMGDLKAALAGNQYSYSKALQDALNYEQNKLNTNQSDLTKIQGGTIE